MEATAKPSTDARDIFTGFTVLDWTFVVLVYAWLMYFILQVGLSIFRPGEFRFDFMPLVNGLLFILVAWSGARIDRRLKDILRQLEESGVVPFASDADRTAVFSAMATRSRQFSRIGATLVAVSMLASIVSYTGLFSGSAIDTANMVLVMPGGIRTQSLFGVFMLFAVFVPVGAIAGSLLGKMVANGRLLETLRGLGYDLSGFASDSGSRTLQAIENVYAYAATATTVLSAVLAAWWVAFTLGFEIVANYDEWRWPFLWLWIISIGGFVFAAYLPVRVFRQRLDKIYGGAAALDQVRVQLSLARQDAIRLRASLAAAATRAERQRLGRRGKDLDQFIAALQARTFSRPILEPAFLNGWLAINALALVVPVAVAGFDGGSPPSPEPRNLKSAGLMATVHPSIAVRSYERTKDALIF